MRRISVCIHTQSLEKGQNSVPNRANVGGIRYLRGCRFLNVDETLNCMVLSGSSSKDEEEEKKR